MNEFVEEFIANLNRRLGCTCEPDVSRTDEGEIDILHAEECGAKKRYKHALLLSHAWLN